MNNYYLSSKGETAMKNSTVKRLSALSAAFALILSLLVVIPTSAAAAASIDAGMVASLYEKINDARTAANKPAYVRSEGLEQIALAYAEVLRDAGADWRRTTNHQTLPNGERVITLARASGVAFTGFNYSVFYNSSPRAEMSDEFHKKVTNGNFTRVGVASIGMDGSWVTVIVYDTTPAAR